MKWKWDKCCRSIFFRSNSVPDCTHHPTTINSSMFYKKKIYNYVMLCTKTLFTLLIRKCIHPSLNCTPLIGNKCRWLSTKFVLSKKSPTLITIGGSTCYDATLSLLIAQWANIYYTWLKVEEMKSRLMRTPRPILILLNIPVKCKAYQCTHVACCQHTPYT
jgi:hypothetical protein